MSKLEIDLERANLLFAVVENCTKHGAFQRIRDAAMKELQEMDRGEPIPPNRVMTPPEGPANALRLTPGGETAPNKPRAIPNEPKEPEPEVERRI